LAIIGIGCLFPGAKSTSAFWANLKNKSDGIGPVPPTHWRPGDYFDPDPKAPDRTYAARGGFLSPIDFDPLEFGIAPNDLEAIDTAQLLALVAAREALVDAGYGPERNFDRSRVSVVLGVTGTQELVIPLAARLGHPRWRRALQQAGVDAATAEEVTRRIADSYVEWQENSFPGLLGNVVAGRIANRLDLHGTNCVVDAACASSLSAIHLAGLELQTGRADLVVTGGVDTFNDIFMYMCFSKTPALSPSGDARPFDVSADGTILGEGLGVLVLKRLADAERDGDRVYAVIKAVGSSSDGKGNAIYAPSAAGQMRALRTAYDLADISPDTVELVEAHGTGTRVGDAVEVEALTEVYRDARAEGTWCALGSVKSQIGHTKAAAGAAGLIKAALALYHKVLPPTIKVSEPIEPLAARASPFYVNNDQRPWLPRPEHPRRAAISSFGFGGSNFHALLEEHQPQKAAIDWPDDVEIVALTGQSREHLVERLHAYEDVSWEEFATGAAESRGAFQYSEPCRLVLVAQRGVTYLRRLVANARSLLAARGGFAHSPDGAYFGEGPAARLGVLFPGQGSQYVGMLRDLACCFPTMQAFLADANRMFEKWGGEGRLSDVIYPPAAFTPDQRRRQEEALRQTDVAQPAIGAVSLGALHVLEAFGVRADAFAGHSYGELPALCAAGCFDAVALHRLSRLRGHLMAAQGGRDAGAMLAVHAPLAAVEQVLREDGIPLVIANRNAPNQAVLSGETAQVLRASEAFAHRQVRHTRLPVAAAFHSPLVADAEPPFRDALQQIPFRSAHRPVFANTTSRPYPDEPDAIRSTLAAQLARPVNFVEEVSNMALAGVRTFVEVGPGSTLARLVASILEVEEPSTTCPRWDTFSLDASVGKRSGMLDLAHALARVAARGHAVRLDLWGPARDKPPAAPKRSGFTVPICGANYVRPKPRRDSTSNRPSRVQAPSAAQATAAANVSSRPLTNTTMSERISSAPASRPGPIETKPFDGNLAQALEITQQNLLAFQKLQEQTAQLHRQFLENQESAQRTLQILVEQQQAILSAGAVLPATRSVASAPAAPAIEALPPAPAQRDAAEPSRNAPALHQYQQGRLPLLSTNGKHSVPMPAPAAEQFIARVPAALASEEVTAALLAVVAEKTGYPPAMLDLGMALDSDLGIDSIKRVEILAALQERLPRAPVVKPEHLGVLHTLHDVADFLSSRSSALDNDPARVDIAPPRVPSHSSNGQATFVAPADPDAERILLEVVSEKTGYPRTMLELGMALDTDLGIDSIKRVEIFSALQERLSDAPAVKADHLGSLRTLRDVVKLLRGENDIAKSAPPNGAVNGAPHAPASSASAVSAVLNSDPAATASASSPPLHSIDKSKWAAVRRYVVRAEPLNPIHQRTRVQLPSGSQLWLVADNSALSADMAATLRALGHQTQLLGWDQVPDAHNPAAVAGLILAAPAGRLPDDFALRAFRWLRRAAPALRRAAEQAGAVLASISQVDGAFGLRPIGAQCDPREGALAGLIKTAAWEFPGLACKAIDTDGTEGSLAPVIVEEVFTRGPVEVGISASGLYTPTLAPADAAAADSSIRLGADDVILITGGGRGVTFEAALALAERYGPKLVLLGRTPLPGPEPEGLAGLQDEAALKRELAARLGRDASPRRIADSYARLLVDRELRSNLSRLRATGSPFIYLPTDVTDPVAVSTSLTEARNRFGPISAVFHGAGVLADRRIEDLTDEQFESVYRPKVEGIRNLLSALGDDPLKALVLYSSTTARFGRAGQAAYAAANEALNKLARQQATLRPGCRVVAINWGPWEGGMVTPALRSIFESEGIGLIPLRAGAEFLMRELQAADCAAEVVALAGPLPTGTMSGHVNGATSAGDAPPLSPAFEQRLTVEDLPVLRSHVIGGRAVLPMALHVEWLAHAALHGNPGTVFHGFDDLRIFQGVSLDEGSEILLSGCAGRAVKQGSTWVVPVALVTRRGDREIVHSTARIVLVNELPAPPATTPLPALEPYARSLDEVYGDILFHGEQLRAIERIEGIGAGAISGTTRTAPPPSQWLRQPLRGQWLAEPLVLDASFQLAILWSFERHGSVCLPCFAGRYRQYVRVFPVGPVRVVVRSTDAKSPLARAEIDYLDASGRPLALMQNYECVIDPALNAAFRQKVLPLGRAHSL
jgi:acyl transferase domain-containing protein/NAD(P)-dependent dehydrogenase (short-subunit alcohol dehydrogenase family)